MAGFPVPESPYPILANAHAPEQPPDDDLSENSSTKPEQKGQEQLSPSSSPAPSPTPLAFTFKENTIRTTWHRQATDDQAYIHIVVERHGFPNGAVICDRVDPMLLFKAAPALRKRLEGHRIFIPSAACLDEEAVESLVYELVRREQGGGGPILVADRDQKSPTALTKMHCVLVLFEMAKEVEALKEILWKLFGQINLEPADVLWIWDTFSGRVPSGSYTAPFAEEYIQMMAWRILNLDQTMELHPDIRRLMELEKEPKLLTEVMETRLRTHGWGKDALNTEAINKSSATVQEPAPVVTAEPANSTGQGQATDSEPSSAAQVHADSNDNTKPATAVDQQQYLTTEALPKPPPFQTSSEAPAQNPLSQGQTSSGFTFTATATTAQQDPKPTTHNIIKTGTKRSASTEDDNTGGPKRAMTGFNSSKPAEISSPFTFNGADTSNSAGPSPSIPLPPTTSSTAFSFGERGSPEAVRTTPAAIFPHPSLRTGLTTPPKTFGIFNQASTQQASGTVASTPRSNLVGTATHPATYTAPTTATPAGFP